MTEPETKIENTVAPNVAQEVTSPVTPAEPESVQDVNWRTFRETRQRERKEREDAEARAKQKDAEASALKAALEAVVNKPNIPANNEQSSDESFKAQVDAYLQKREQEQERIRQQREVQEIPGKLQQTFSDFNQVCTHDNIDYLKFHYPEVAHAFERLPDTYETWVNIYKAVKRFVPNMDSKKDAAKAEKNFSKPQAISKPGVTQTGDQAPVYLDDKKRNDNWARMQRVIKGGAS